MPAGAPKGNTNGRKGRLFEQAFIREIKARDLKEGDGETLRRIAQKIIDMALEGDLDAFAAARDTVDGKPAHVFSGQLDLNLRGRDELIGKLRAAENGGGAYLEAVDGGAAGEPPGALH